METILEALKAMGKATAREIAARMRIDTPDVLVMLRELEELDQITHLNGWWQLAEAAPKPAATRTPIAPPVNKVNETILTALLKRHGAQTSEQLAKLAGTTPRVVASTLAMSVNKGRIVREKRGNAFHFNLPGESTIQPEETTQPEEDLILDTPPVTTSTSAASFLDTIPQLVPTGSHPVVLTPQIIATEIRRTKSRLTQLQKLRITVRALARQQRALGM